MKGNKKLNSKYISYGTGKRKEATARVYVGSNSNNNVTFEINGISYDKYFKSNYILENLFSPLDILKCNRSLYYFYVRVEGGGINGQSDAIKYGIAKALALLSDDFKKILKTHNLLTVDTRKVESKKYGLKKARKRQQYTKR